VFFKGRNDFLCALVQLHGRSVLSEKGMNDSIFIKAGHQFKRVRFTDILWLEANRNYVNVFCREQVLRSFITLEKMSTYLPQELFCRIHRSYIVLIGAVERFDASVLWISDRQLPIGKRYKNALIDRVVVASPAPLSHPLPTNR